MPDALIGGGKIAVGSRERQPVMSKKNSEKL